MRWLALVVVVAGCSGGAVSSQQGTSAPLVQASARPVSGGIDLEPDPAGRVPIESAPITAPSTAHDAPVPCLELVIEGAGFGTDSWEIPADVEAALVQLADRLHALPVRRIDVVGHADKRPSTLGNERLSLLRAEAVAERLHRLGVPAAVLRAEGRGDREPRAPGDSAEDLATNRRISVHARC